MEEQVAEPFELPIERGKVQEFARAVGARDPQHYLKEGAVSPTTFLMTAQFWQGPQHRVWPAGRDMSRVLHASQEFVFPKGPPRAGDRLSGLQRIEDSYTKEGKRGGMMTFTVMVSEYRDEAGNLVAEVRNTLVETSKSTGAGT
ncbi:MaoC family dehydratase N-terminal domain-containing protein [Mycobacterium sp. CVI_P3]|uniref:MaoC family dehydratase N-terminal domain-containing protein n=1 Tax=Mycobacterium pinniadriaticum TaxID=2994102 RepID=A0ABT3SMW0_9MYCO|nr:MaoC family dehydratase N-terminal domain-containing protein [Mycobacterium pinniadriaticum]MCX2934438.1 MaoC family dehydratase N-terminal domain-containing protein [Mycobacterium pinniadriaticum]MCX2940861.1 MaoC family dehydratase N-terminal domain-containing protein [Mycobacterium pinniadriaticum]